MWSGRLHPAWVVAAAGFVALVMSAGFRSTAGVLLVPLHDEFGWSHETIGLAVSLNLIAFAVVYGLDWVATVPPTSALATRDFGDRWGGLVFAWIFTRTSSAPRPRPGRPA